MKDTTTFGRGEVLAAALEMAAGSAVRVNREQFEQFIRYKLSGRHVRGERINRPAVRAWVHQYQVEFNGG